MFKRLFQIKKLKCGPAEIEFFGDVEIKGGSGSSSSVRIEITKLARKDAKTTRVAKKDLLHEITHTLQRHSRLLDGSFDSLPLSLLNHTVLISYTVGSSLTVERVLPTADKTPLYRAWAELLSLYRGVAGLPYRTGDTSRLLQRSDAKRALRMLASLLGSCRKYLTIYRRCHPHIEVSWDLVLTDNLMQEIEFALADGQTGNAVARIEILLSNAHRLILTCAPTASIGSAVEGLSESEFQSQPVDQGKRILVVDDEPVIRALAREFLQNAGLEVDEASDGTEALQLLLTKKYAVVVADLVMPKLSGTAVVTMAKALNSTDWSVGISGYFSDCPEARSSFDVDMDKPFHDRELQDNVCRLLGNKPQGLPNNREE